jgi:ATP-binding protein involved in chromosome partitioning
MSAPTEDDIKRALAQVRDPVSGQNVVAAGLIEGLALRNNHVSFAIEVPPERGPASEPLRKACEDAVHNIPGILSVTAVLTAHRERAAAAQPRPASQPSAHAHSHSHAHGNAGISREAGIPGVAAIIAVASGKGGVGKSTVAVNLALALSSLGKKTGLLDADIYGPSAPRLLNITDKPESDGKQLKPIERYGIKTMSIGYLVDTDTPMIWRGPMVMGALTQMLSDVAWAPLDILVVDMPPGTGDAQLTLAQRVPLAGAVIVSTPQDLALIDARKGLAMFRKTEVPILGIIENMSTFICPTCGSEHHIFGHGGARATAAELDCEFLGEIPLLPIIRETSDAGTPIVASRPDSPEANAFLKLAERIAEKLSVEAKPAPKIIIE